jgi:BirA family biotin operon repressor/biotin-[acetyl-CoA-carboxylase] ligase
MQTAGRGTRGREWIAEMGGLWMSVVCRPRSVSGIETLSVRTGLVLAELLERLLPPGSGVAIKWPNDLMLADAKVGGILAEARWQGEVLSWVVVGVGINVRNSPPLGLPHPATSLALHGGPERPELIVVPVAEAVSRATEAAGPLSPQELEAFRARDWLTGRHLALPHRGIAHGITALGRLQILTSDGSLIATGGTVQLGPPA